jgi:bacterioferritin-associated ferredoxin
MTACACTGRSFAEVESRMVRDGLSALEAEGLTGCGSLCTACLPDLRDYLRRVERPVLGSAKEYMP